MIRLRRWLWILSGGSAAWSIAVALTGGFVVELGAVRLFASRQPLPAAIVAILCASCAWAFTPAADRRRWLVRWLPPQIAVVAASAAAIATIAIALRFGAPYAGGSDAYGYVSQAELWAHGKMTVEQPFVQNVDWPFKADAFTPMGYLPVNGGAVIVPIFAPGLPMVMAVFQLIGGRDAVYYVVPLLGGLAVWMTFLMGTLLAGRTVGAVAAILLATSPAFLIQLMLPMSDIPVATWWTVGLTLALVDRRDAALGSGLAISAAILTRPNLVPLAILPAGLLIWRIVRERTWTGAAARQLLCYCVGVVPGCLAVAAINARLYGSPLISGQRLVNAPLSWQNLLPNLARYPRWLMDTETPLVLLAFLAPFIVQVAGEPLRRGRQQAVALMWLGFIGAVFISYLFFTPSDTWFWLRFLLPAFPPLLVLTSVALVGILARLEGGLRVVLTAVVVGAVAWHGVQFGRQQGVFVFKEGERKAVVIGEYVASRLPSHAVLLSMWHSGSIRHYSGRLTIRYEALPPPALDSVLADLRRLGYYPYIALEQWEEPAFRQRFDGYSKLAALDWPPAVLLNHSTKVRIYDPADRESWLAGQQPPTEIIK